MGTACQKCSSCKEWLVVIREHLDNIRNLQEQNEILMEAVEFYDRESREHPSGWICKGGIAKKALEKIKEIK